MSTVKQFFDTAQQFLKLEKVEIGGIRGKALTTSINKVHEEFDGLYGIFAQRSYDSLNPKDKGFLKDYAKFNNKTFALDRKLGAILIRAFDDCIVTESIFKLLHIFGSLLQRSIISKELADKMPQLVKMLNQEMDEAKSIFMKQQNRIKELGKPLTDRNMPAVAGQLRFSKEIKDRISCSVKNFRELNHPICATGDGELIIEKYKEMVCLLYSYDEDVFRRWAQSADKKTGESLHRPLLVREGKQATLRVNFGKDLLSILHEVKCLQKDFPQREIPEEAKDIFKSFNDFRNYNNSLDQTVSLYNYLKLNTTKQEYDLIKEELFELDEKLHHAEETLDWNSPNIWNYIEEIRRTVDHLVKRVRAAQENVSLIKKEISVWETQPLFQRISDPKQEPFLDMKNLEEAKKKRTEELKLASFRIQVILEENCKLFKANFGEASKLYWENYLNNLDEIVANGILKAVAVSLGYLVDESDKKKDVKPLLQATMELCEPNIIFKPSLDLNIQNNFYDVCLNIIDDIFNMGSLVKRVAQTSGDANYLKICYAHPELNSLKDQFINNVKQVMDMANTKKDTFLEYSYLWKESRHDTMYFFLNFARELTQEELKLLDEDESLVKKQDPTLSQFKKQIDKYEAVYDIVKEIETTKTFNNWFKTDIEPFKISLMNLVKRWSYLFKRHLMDYVKDNLDDLNKFIEEADEGLMTQVHEGDYKSLIKVMKYLQLVKEKQSLADSMFEPLKDIIDLLRNYGMEIPQESIVLLKELPEKWSNTKRLTVSAKQQVAPLQGMEIGKLKNRIEEYGKEEKRFREEFKTERYYNFDCKSPYEYLGKANSEIKVLEEQVDDLQTQAVLFEVEVPDYPMIKQCRKENKLLKQLWDYVFLVRTSIDEWKTTPWCDIDVENMDMECKKFSKDLRGMDKDMRNWNVYTGLESTVRNMITSLRACGELQNPSIRERHWFQLVQATKVQFIMSDDTVLSDLLSLNLHNFEDEVHNIVDKACKEMAMEKMLKDLDINWKDMEFTHEKHPRTGCTLLRTSEELIETLEENQVQLQNMMTSKYIGFFLKEISSWQKTLGVVDTVIAFWMDVQRTWSYLESIFIGSEDIRKQLPDDSDRFDRIDSDFKVLMKNAEKEKNVIRATGVPNLAEELEEIQSQLSLCEKALAEYLETKRLAFPRFYFSSSADLLDILSNGNQPLMVAKHLTKLFDSMAKMKMKEVDGIGTNTAVVMVAKDGETVDFVEECVCEGQVEVWLNKLLLAMRETIRFEFSKSVKTYENTAREKWLFLYPAQVALAGTQIFWSTEVTQAFTKLEEGYENALKDYYKKQIMQLNMLITCLLGDLTKGERQKIMTICTIDVHSRDVVGGMIQKKVEANSAFAWQSQLKHRWDDPIGDCFANICDAQFRYCHEYLGNTPRLVITPLTDRCYITLTQSLHLIMGGAPQGPAGTGKTETTKDLGKAIGMMVYVFNCSEQMDYKSCGNIFKGLAQTGAWGCFDEFNRITVEVLSVIAVQVKSIQDAMTDKKEKFDFMGAFIPMCMTIGYFITMNPG